MLMFLPLADVGRVAYDGGMDTTVTGEELRRWREAHGLSQTALARALGVEHNTVYRWEAGMRSPPAGRILDLALTALALEMAGRGPGEGSP